MNWRVGLLRLWVVGTAIWFVIIAWIASASWPPYDVFNPLYWDHWAHNTLPGPSCCFSPVRAMSGLVAA
jgi:hypothetical protein